ncbi:alpha-(1,3)-fucosyltransferase fut-6-like [Symsagittifera roscoffensis]|uniref:alpha-(1,3)-fucosyltransferase fut-6-like n=1 Tax=Symsagittifera roscoffensis TaxID=84072 RepID=UPI00307B799E
MVSSKLLKRCVMQYRPLVFAALLLYFFLWLGLNKQNLEPSDGDGDLKNAGEDDDYITENQNQMRVSEERIEHPTVHLAAPLGFNEFFNKNMRDLCDFDFDCLFHHVKELTSETMHKFDVLIMKGPPGVEKVRSLWKGAEKKRLWRQLWMVSYGENTLNGVNQQGITEELDGLFNWTGFHSLNATFFNSVFHVKKSNELKMVDVIENYRSFNKSKAFCWAINNCANTWTPRVTLGLEIIRQLPEKIHMFGGGAKNCFKEAADFIEDHGSFGNEATKNEPQKSRQAHMRDCKFYFSFENANCTGYVTEKFSNPLAVYAVPIVNGWPQSYNNFLPSSSYIHARQFGSTEKLVEHLSYLLRNETAYYEYHKWRTEYKAFDHLPSYPERECKICKKALEVKESLDGPNPQITTIKSLKGLFRGQHLSKCDHKIWKPSYF